MKKESVDEVSSLFLELYKLKLASVTCFSQTLESLNVADSVNFVVSSKNHSLKVSIYLS